MHALLTFVVADRDYAVQITNVREVIRAVQITPLPNCPSEVLGVINLRGIPTVVIDLRQRLGLPTVPITADSPLIHIERDHGKRDRIETENETTKVESSSFLVLVDRVNEVVYTALTASGVVTIGDRLVVLLEPNHMLSEQTAQWLDIRKLDIHKGQVSLSSG